MSTNRTYNDIVDCLNDNNELLIRQYMSIGNILTAVERWEFCSKNYQKHNLDEHLYELKDAEKTLSIAIRKYGEANNSQFIKHIMSLSQ